MKLTMSIVSSREVDLLDAFIHQERSGSTVRNNVP